MTVRGRSRSDIRYAVGFAIDRYASGRTRPKGARDGFPADGQVYPGNCRSATAGAKSMFATSGRSRGAGVGRDKLNVEPPPCGSAIWRSRPKADRRAFIVLPPDRLPASADYVAPVSALGRVSPAQANCACQTTLAARPCNLFAYVALGNAAYRLVKLTQSEARAEFKQRVSSMFDKAVRA